MAAGDVSRGPFYPLIYVPWMHAGLVGGGLPAGVRFLDPGLGPAEAEGSGEYVRPDILVLSGRELKRQLHALRLFGEQFTKPDELRAFAQGGFSSFRREKAMGAGEEQALSRFLREQGVSPQALEQPNNPSEADQSLHSQIVLLLAWSMEERLLELKHAHGALNQAMRGFDEALGLEEGEDSAGFSEFSKTYPVDSSIEAAPPWPLVVEHMLALLPQGAVFVTREAPLVETWKEAGLSFTSLDASDREQMSLGPEFEPGWLYVRAAGRQLTGRTGAAGPKHLDKEVTVLIPAQSAA